jgi:DNA-binding CsgD family transcriptional regulator
VRVRLVLRAGPDEPTRTGRRGLLPCPRAGCVHPRGGTRTFWRLKREHPLCSYQARTGDFAAHKLSDFVTRRELHRLEIYVDFFRPNAVEYELEVGLPAQSGHTKVLGFDSGRRDFGDRDRLLLDLLRPHLVHLYNSARTRRLAAAIRAGTDRSGELVLLDSAGRIEFASVLARRLLHHFFGDPDSTRLPEAIEGWLACERGCLNGDTLPNRGKPLTIDLDRRRLVFTRVPGGDRTLLLAEAPLPPSDRKPLSRREWEIVDLLDAGKSNAEIAVELWIAPGTVRTHLENIYAKLGVHSRTAALARVRDLRQRRR